MDKVVDSALKLSPWDKNWMKNMDWNTVSVIQLMGNRKVFFELDQANSFAHIIAVLQYKYDINLPKTNERL